LRLGKSSREFRKLRSGRVRRFVVEEAGEFCVLDDYGGVPLDGVEIFFLKGIAGFRGNEHFPGQSNSATGVFGSDGLHGGQSFIDTDDELGDVVQPCELWVVNDQAKELASVDVAMLALVVAAFHVEQSFVEAEKSEAQREKLLSGGGIVVRGI